MPGTPQTFRRWFSLLIVTILAAGCSADRGWIIKPMEVPAAPGSAESNLARGPGGDTVLSWLEPDGAVHALKFSVLTAAGWSPPRTVARSENWFVNWADFPSVVPINDDTWAAHWLVKRPGNAYSYDVAVAISRDAGDTWGEAISPHDDGTATEHGFVSLYPHDDAIGIVWLDGRAMAGSGHDAHSGAELVAAGGASDEPAMTLRYATISADGELESQGLIDERVCDCCQTDVALTGAGPIAVYRDRSKGEVRDIHIATADGQTWQPRGAVADDGWVIKGCPVNGPAVAARGDNVVVAWFTAADNDSRVRTAYSRDGGKTFGPSVDIDVDAPLGRTDVALMDNGDAVVSWLRGAGASRAELCVTEISREGQVGPVNVIAVTDAARMSGFPRLLRHGRGLVLAWTDVTDGVKSLRSVSLTTRRP